MLDNEKNINEENLKEESFAEETSVNNTMSDTELFNKEWKIGDVVSNYEYTYAALFCNKSNDIHIALVDGVYKIVANDPMPEPTKEEIVAKMEAETGLTRVMREMVLAENSGASDYVKAKANEIEDLAKQLRK